MPTICFVKGSYGVGDIVVVGLEVVDQCAAHVVHLDRHLAGEAVEVEGHLSVVRVGNDGEVGTAVVIVVDAIEGTDKPIAPCLALGRASVVDGDINPDGVFYMLKHIQSAVLSDGNC